MNKILKAAGVGIVGCTVLHGVWVYGMQCGIASALATCSKYHVSPQTVIADLANDKRFGAQMTSFLIKKML